MKKLRKNVMAGMTAVAAGMVLTGCSGMPSMSGAEFRRRLMAEIRRQNEARNAAQAQTPAPAPDMSRITEKIEDVLMEQGEGIAIRDFVSGLDEETIGSIIGYDGSIDRISLLYGPPDVRSFPKAEKRVREILGRKQEKRSPDPCRNRLPKPRLPRKLPHRKADRRRSLPLRSKTRPKKTPKRRSWLRRRRKNLRNR